MKPVSEKSLSLGEIQKLYTLSSLFKGLKSDKESVFILGKLQNVKHIMQE